MGNRGGVPVVEKVDLGLAAVHFTLLDKSECKSICFASSEQINEYLTV